MNINYNKKLRITDTICEVDIIQINDEKIFIRIYYLYSIINFYC